MNIIYIVYINKKKRAEFYDMEDLIYFLEQYEDKHYNESYHIGIVKDIINRITYTEEE